MTRIVTYWDHKRCEYRVGVAGRTITRGPDAGKIEVRAMHVGGRVVRCRPEDVEKVNTPVAVLLMPILKEAVFKR